MPDMTRTLLAIASATLFLAGCATPDADLAACPEEASTNAPPAEDSASTNAPLAAASVTTNAPLAAASVTTNAFPAAASVTTNAPAASSTHAPAVPATHAPAAKPAPKSRPWAAEFRHGSQTARIDGVAVILLEPAILDLATLKGKPSPVDYKNTVCPLLNAAAKPLVDDRPVRVFIDPGHGGDDSGALSQDRKLVESKIVLDVAKRLADYLQKSGFDVRLSRQDNTLPRLLEERTLMAAKWKADIFVSIHINATGEGETSACGLETFILPPAGTSSTYAGTPSWTVQAGNGNDVRNMQLGFAIQRRALKTSRLADRGLRRARFAVLREARMPAALVECGFITSARDRKILGSVEGRDRLARGIYQGICDYAFGTLAPGLPAHEIPKKAVPAANASSDASGPAMPVAPTKLATGSELPEKIAVPGREPAWQAPRVADDPAEDPRLRKIREEAAKAAGF